MSCFAALAPIRSRTPVVWTRPLHLAGGAGHMAVGERVISCDRRSPGSRSIGHEFLALNLRDDRGCPGPILLERKAYVSRPYFLVLDSRVPQ